ncbi:MAG TPA: YihY/virulence factor BrkB family protein [Pyrinomonadaceae bacterium]|nr:YihY/virulence factor BrkB family protein [Pyrinomonadaceae bacterium]
MASLWTLGGLTWKKLAQRIWEQISADDLFGRAAQLSYYFLLALFPLLLFLVTLLGYFAEAGSELRDTLLGYLGEVMPASATELVRTTIDEVAKQKGGGKLSFGILAALWAASNGMGAISETLNAAYNVEETRPWWKIRLVTVGLTVALALLIVIALTLIFGGSKIADLLAGTYGFSQAFTLTWKIVQWPIVLSFVLLTFNLIYYFAPDLKDQDWKWVSPGAAIGVALWLLVSFAFRLYLHFFDSYSATYGSLGALIIMMLWFYLTGAAILIGGEINSEIENAAAEAGEPDAKERGEKSPDEFERKGKSKSRRAKTRRVAKA